MTFTAVEAADGFVTLEYAPPVNNSRALSLPLAKAATDFYEVIFEDDSGELTRRNFREGQTIRMKVKEGAYNNNGLPHAYMFAGRYETKTLLAIGVIRKIEYKDGDIDTGDAGTSDLAHVGGSADDFKITSDGNTHRVTFELEALTTNVKADAASTFRTWGGVNVAPNDVYRSGQSVLMMKTCDYTLPVFTLDKDNPTPAVIDIKTTHAGAITLNSAPAQTTYFDSKGFFQAGLDVPMVTVAIALTNSADVFDILDDGAAPPQTTGIQIPVTLGATGKDGLGQFSYAVPVFNYNASSSPSTGVEAVTWYLSGGVSNSLYDQGTALDSQGGTIVLGSGDLSGFLTVDEDGFFIGGGYRPPISNISRYIISGGAGSFTAVKDGVTVGTPGSAIQDVIDAIRTHAAGNAAAIQFGNGAAALDIGAESALFSGAWGHITLTGKITGNLDVWGYGVISIGNNISAASTADISNTSSGKEGSAIVFGSTGTLAISGGAISSTASYGLLNNADGTVNISGGVFSSANYEAVGNSDTGIINITGGVFSSAGIATVMNYSDGTIHISGGTFSSAGIATIATVYNTGESGNGTGTINITGGTITAASGIAVHNKSTGTIRLGGNPTVQGAIYQATSAAVTVSGGIPAFTPGGKVYTLDFASYYVGRIAVTGGAPFIDNFALPISATAWELAVSGGDLVLAAAGPGHAPGGHVWSFAQTTTASSAAVGYLGLTCDICGEMVPNVPYAAFNQPAYLSLSASGGTASINDSNNPPSNLIIPAYYYYSGNYYPVTEIDGDAFYYDWTITSVAIPASVTSIGTFAFHSCANLVSVIFQAGSALTDIGEEAFSSSGLTNITLPAGLKTIGNSAFRFCYDLAGLNIPSGLTTIGEYAFGDCTIVPGISIPPSVTTVGHDIFEYWGSLSPQTITVPFLEGQEPPGWQVTWKLTCFATISYAP